MASWKWEFRGTKSAAIVALFNLNAAELQSLDVASPGFGGDRAVAAQLEGARTAGVALLESLLSTPAQNVNVSIHWYASTNVSGAPGSAEGKVTIDITETW